MRKSDFPQYWGGVKKSRGPRHFISLMRCIKEWYDRYPEWCKQYRREIVSDHLETW